MVKFLVAGTGTLLIGAAAVWGFAATADGSKNLCTNRIVPLGSDSAACQLARLRGESHAREWLLAIK